MAGNYAQTVIMKSPFIVIESLDAAGGSTQAGLLIGRIKKAGYKAYQFHYPQEDEPTGRMIYDKFLLHKNKNPFSRREQALLYIQDFFAESKKLREIITRPGKNCIVSDRYCTSTMAYQTIGTTGAARKRMLAWIHWLCWEGKPALPKPDMVILLDLPVSISLKRLNERPGTKDFFENRRRQEAIRRSYLRLAKEAGWKVVHCADDAGQQRSREDIHADVWQAVMKLVG